MDITLTKWIAALGLAACLAGCKEETIPEPTADNCTPQMQKKILADLSKEANRNTFIANCNSFQQAHQHTEWTFKKSPRDDF
nr:entry exclusion lipoprotein TrbK [uncultured Pseudomonas sp.]